jgi:hypothetical protein
MTTILKSTSTSNRARQRWLCGLRIGIDEVINESLNSMTNTRELIRINLTNIVKIEVVSSNRLRSLLICLGLVGLVSGIRGGLVDEGLVDGLVGRNGTGHLGVSSLEDLETQKGR